MDEKKTLDWTGGIIALYLSPIYFIFLYYGKGGVGRAVFIILYCFVIVIKARWRLRNHVWFWGIIALLLALHIPLLLLVNWPSGRIPSIAILPVAFLDVLVILGSVNFVEKFILKSGSSE